MTDQLDVLPWPLCSLLLFVATPAEEDALREQAGRLGLDFRKEARLIKHFREQGLGDDVWAMGVIGGETVLAIGPSRVGGRIVMGPHGRLGSAAKGMRYIAATGAQGIIQLGMAFGVARGPQKLGDVLVSTSLIPYDKRDVKPSCSEPSYYHDYSALEVEPARPALVERCLREKERSRFGFSVLVGAMLSGAARIHCAKFRDELYITTPHGSDPIVGGEMEGVGLLAAVIKADDPTWCVVKGISDFADERRDEDIKIGRTIAPQNAAYFVLSSLVNDAKMLKRRRETMSELDRMLEAPQEAALPPLVRDCKRYQDAGDMLKVELYRPDGGGGLSRTELVIHRWREEEEQELHQVEWDDGVNAGLVELGIKAVNLDQEGSRFALAIRAALRKVELRYGDGYLNAVLVDLLDESDLTKNNEIADVRKHVYSNSPERTRSYDACRELMANEIAGRAVELRDKLKYKPEEVKAVMSKSLAIYLDSRFSVSSRRRFGLLL